LPDDEIWKTATRLLMQKIAAEEATTAELKAKYARLDAEARERAEQDRRRIQQFLDRMYAVGNPGCSKHDLTEPGHRRRLTWQARAAGRSVSDNDGDELVVDGWVLEANEGLGRFKDSNHLYFRNTTVLSVDGEAFRAGTVSGTRYRERLDPSQITMEMLVGTLMRYGVAI
jgi:hypothetical protein